MSAILDKLAGEPVAVVAVIDAVFALLVGVGLNLDPKIAGALDVVVIAVLGLYARSKVIPVVKHDAIVAAVTSPPGA